MEDCTLINKEQHRWKQNDVHLQKQEEDCKLIADGEGMISHLSPVGPRKAKMTALKNTSEFLHSGNL